MNNENFFSYNPICNRLNFYTTTQMNVQYSEVLICMKCSQLDLTVNPNLGKDDSAMFVFLLILPVVIHIQILPSAALKWPYYENPSS